MTPMFITLTAYATDAKIVLNAVYIKQIIPQKDNTCLIIMTDGQKITVKESLKDILEPMEVNVQDIQ